MTRAERSKKAVFTAPPDFVFAILSAFLSVVASAAGSAPARASLIVETEAGPAWQEVLAPVAGAPGAWRRVALEGEAPGSQLIPASPTAASPTAAGVPPADASAVAAERPLPPYRLSPSLGGSVPTGFVGGWGDYYIAGSAGTPGKQRGGSPEGAINLGLSLGDPLRSVGVDVNWGIGSIKQFNANGSVGVSVGRILVNRSDLQVAVAGGVLDAYTYGFEPGQPTASGYGAVSVALPLRPGDPVFPQRLQFSAGGGGSSFGAIDANFQTTEAGFFVAAGVELLPNLGVSIGQSSRSTNVNLSWIPLRRLPVFVNLVAADVFDATPFGAVGVLSVGWGDSLRSGGFFSD